MYQSDSAFGMNDLAHILFDKVLRTEFHGIDIHIQRGICGRNPIVLDKVRNKKQFVGLGNRERFVGGHMKEL